MIDLGPIHITKAHKDVSRHGTNQICVMLEAAGIFPRGRRPHILAFMPISEDRFLVHSLYGYTAHDIEVPVAEVKAWIKSLPVVNSKTTPVPSNLWTQAERLAREVDREIEIFDIGEAPKVIPSKGIELPKSLYWYSISELKQICQDRGLSDEGNKEVLIRRLRQSA